MMFILRAVFWIAVVAAFTPTGFHAAPDGPFAQEARRLADIPSAAGAAGTARESASGFCENNAEACAAASELGAVAGVLSEAAVTRAEHWLEARNSDRQNGA